jgi:predicted dehydrogenase
MSPAQVASLRWGVVGTGRIAGKFVDDLRLLPSASVTAVGSRTRQSAETFGDAHDVPRRHASYEDLVADPEVDAVYVATPHPGHHAAARLGIEAGKAVLVEKPFTMDAAEAVDLVEAARARGTFLMEAMWTRFLPQVVRLRELLHARSLGEVTVVTAELGEWMEPDPTSRLYAPELGGGALLDLGIYPVSFASMVLGPPSSVRAVSRRAMTGVDAVTAVLLEHESGIPAVVTVTLAAPLGNRAQVAGTEARVELGPGWIRPGALTLLDRAGEVREHFAPPHEGNGLRHQALEVGRCIAAGRTESAVIPLDETVAIMHTLDEVRRQIGLAYPR